MNRRAEGLHRVEQEIRQAKAEALGRLGERLDRVLARLRDLDRRLDLAPEAGCGDGERSALRNRLRHEAARLVDDLIIQREALGLSSHRAVHERYPVPARRHSQGLAQTGTE